MASTPTSMKGVGSCCWARVVLGALMLVGGLACERSKPESKIDPQSFEEVEDLSESLANDLLDLSVAARARDHEAAAQHFAESLLATPLPAVPGPEQAAVKWISTRPWEFAQTPVTIDRVTYMKHWEVFFARLTEIEDVRFKVKAATFDDERHGGGRIFWYVVGRDEKGRREWIRATLALKAERESDRVEPQRGPDASTTPATVDRPNPERWKIRELVVQNLESTIAEVDLFSEVAEPAGMAARVPAFGEPGNDGFAWHGAAAADVDNDGDVDLFASGEGRNYLYLNRGDGRFDEHSNEAGLSSTLTSATGPLWLDYDADGDVDLFLSAVGEQMLFQNRLVPEGRLEFQDVSVAAGVSVSAIGFSAVAGDVNSDGRPDIYVCSYNLYGKVMPNSWDNATNGTPNLLFVNQGDGRFLEEAAARGVAGTGWSYAAQFVDLDHDGDQDLYVANDFGVKNYFRNDGERFTDIAAETGLLDPGNGMGVCFGDYDNDGDLDLHVANMSSTAGNRILGRLYSPDTKTAAGATKPGVANSAQSAVPERAHVLKKLASGNTLYEQLPDGTWKNVTSDIGGLSAGWAWGGGFVDFDNDGWEDLYTANGFVSGKSMKDT